MKTYLTVYFSSDGGKASDVTKALQGLGFKPTKGPHDYALEWPAPKDIQELVAFADKVHEKLKGHKVMFKLETVG